MKRIAALLAVLLATACGQTEVADKFRTALPTASEVQVGEPTAGQGPTAAAPGGPLTRMAEGVAASPARSDYAGLSYVFATSVNSSVAVTLLRLHAVTFWPPTSCTDQSCTWGPGSEPGDVNDWELVVTRAGESYDYALQGRKKGVPGASWVPVISGRANPSAVPHRGQGTLLVDFDAAWAGLAHGVNLDGTPKVQEDFGRVEIAYDARGELKVQAAFVGAKDKEKFDAGNTAARLDAWYDFAASGHGGQLQLAFRTQPVEVQETVSLHTRWAATGNGRGDAVATSYQYPGQTYHASQCWAGAALGHAMTYDTTQDPAFGREADCLGFPTADEKPFPDPFPPALP